MRRWHAPIRPPRRHIEKYATHDRKAQMDELPDGYVEVHFHPQALEDFQVAYPDLPAGDEMVMRIKIKPCSHCGNELPRDQIGGIDPLGITEDGELIGDFVCLACMEKGR